MVILAYMYVLARIAGLLEHTGLWFGLVMAVLTTYNLICERREL